jgi:hypothetical protein
MILCSYDLQMVSKSNYQSKHRVKSLNTRTWQYKWCIWYFCMYVTIQCKQKQEVERTLRLAIESSIKDGSVELLNEWQIR